MTAPANRKPPREIGVAFSPEGDAYVMTAAEAYPLTLRGWCWRMYRSVIADDQPAATNQCRHKLHHIKDEWVCEDCGKRFTDDDKPAKKRKAKR